MMGSVGFIRVSVGGRRPPRRGGRCRAGVWLGGLAGGTCAELRLLRRGQLELMPRKQRSAQDGRYQLCSPSNPITAGRSSPRTIVASMKIATARPTPSCLLETTEAWRSSRTATITIAALVITPAEWVMPRRIASRVSRPRSYPSRIWRDWVGLALIALGCLAVIAFTNGTTELVFAALFGAALMMALVGWIVGDVHALPWLWGSIGEQLTEEVLGGLDGQWICEHDLPAERGNFDHVLVGAPGGLPARYEAPQPTGSRGRGSPPRRSIPPSRSCVPCCCCRAGGAVRKPHGAAAVGSVGGRRLGRLPAGRTRRATRAVRTRDQAPPLAP